MATLMDTDTMVEEIVKAGGWVVGLDIEGMTFEADESTCEYIAALISKVSDHDVYRIRDGRWRIGFSWFMY